MLKIRRPLGRLIFNMVIAIVSKTVFLIETASFLASANNDVIRSAYQHQSPMSWQHYIFTDPTCISTIKWTSRSTTWSGWWSWSRTVEWKYRRQSFSQTPWRTLRQSIATFWLLWRRTPTWTGRKNLPTGFSTCSTATLMRTLRLGYRRCSRPIVTSEW